MENYVRLPLENASNVRDLGGYPSMNNELTNFGYLLRGDDLSKLNQKDIQFLLEYGLSSVIDLRSDNELVTHPDPFAVIEEVHYKHISLIEQDVIDPAFVSKIMKNPETFLLEMNFEFVKNGTKGIKEVFDFIAEQKGGVLFHCTAGKDRTGLIAMLLLGLVGVSKLDILTNYMVTEIYIRESLSTKDKENKIPKELLQSKPEYIEPIIDYILETFGGFEEYLLHIGVEKNNLDTIISRFVKSKVKIN